MKTREERIIETVTQALQQPEQVHEGDQVEAQLTKYKSVDEMIKEIDADTDKVAMKHKMDKVKGMYEALESKLQTLEEGEHSDYLAPGKLREMKKNIKDLRRVYERMDKEYTKKYLKQAGASKKPVVQDIKEPSEPLENTLQESTFNLRKYLHDSKATKVSKLLKD